MDALSLDALAAQARARGLDLTGDELAALLPLVQALRASVGSLGEARLGDVEPAGHFRIV